MDPRFARLDSLFQAARRLPPAARPAYLDAEASGDPDLRAEVEGLLQALDSAPEAEPAAAVAGLVRGIWEEGTDAPDRFDGFRILRRIASGGMGVVYEAEQANPRRRVALKVLHPGAATQEGRRRFEREAEILARLHHPFIAQIHVYGASPSPLGESPFLAMELVDGAPLNLHARSLDARGKLELLARVCDAVAHAHLNGVIHRDLKPSNILVTPSGEPKVLDFGVARLLDGDPAVRTRTGQVIGTLAYMSPEQATGDLDRVDARTDVYSLGVLGYEMLCGRLPHEIDAANLPGAIRRIVEEEPPDPGTLDRQLRGDVSLILRKALAKEPDRRYGGAGALADDLRRHLRDESVLARPPTATYQLRKFVRRHKALVGGVVATMTALLAGIVLALRAAREEERQRIRADGNAAEARWAVSQALLEAASSDLQSLDGQAARRFLERIPPEHRGWEWSHLHARTDTSIRRVPFRTENPRELLLGPGGGTLSVLDDGGPALVDLHSGERSPAVLPALATPRLLLLGGAPAVVGRDGSRLCWARLEGGAPAFAPFQEGIGVAAGSADGSRIAVSTRRDRDRSAIRILDALSGATVANVPADPVDMFSLAFSSDGSRIAAGGFRLGIHVIDASTGTPLRELHGHSGTATALAFSPDGRFLLSGARDKALILWRLEDGTTLQRWTAHAGEVTAVAWSANGTRLASGDALGVIRVWDAASGACERVLLGHEGGIGSLAFRGEETLVSAGQAALREWNVGRGRDPDVLRYHAGREEGNVFCYVYSVEFSRDGSILASCGWDHTVRLVDPATGDLLATLDAGSVLVDLAFRPDARRLLVSGSERQLWDPETGRRLAVDESRRSAVACAASPDGSTFAAAELYHLCLLGSESLETGRRWNDHPYPHPGADCAWSPDGALLATAGEDGVYLRRMPEGGIVRRIEAHAGGALCVVFDRTGTRLATGGADRMVRVWDPASGRLLRELAGHREKVYAVAFHPDGRELASGANDNSIRIWNLDRGVERIGLRGHGHYVRGLAFSPDGRTLASASGDNTVRLWSTVPMRERHALAQAEREARVRISPRVDALFAELGDPRAVADALHADAAMPEADRRAALHLVLLRSAGPR